MIERHWKGVAKPQSVKEYVAYLQDDTFKKMEKLDGFVSAKILQKELAEGTEFLIVTTWQNIDAVKQFAGTNIENAVVPEKVKEMMLTYDKHVQYYKIV